MTIDRDGFERALANVLDNALRHTPPGGTIDITCGEDTDGAFVEVVDDGPGIAADLLPHIFEPMVRANSNGRTGGTGLGLTIAARLLQNQGGTHRRRKRTRPRRDPHTPGAAHVAIAHKQGRASCSRSIPSARSGTRDGVSA